jgi:N-acetylneuraminate synthase
MSEQEASTSENLMDLQVTGEQRERYLNRSLKRIEEWGLSMPGSEVIVFDFGLNEFEKTGLVEFWVANEEECGYCGKFMFLFDGQECPAHEHPIKHETFYVVKGSIEMAAGGERRILNEGDVYAMTPGTKHSFSARGDALVLEVSMPCLLRDNIFEDRRIGADGVM